jgi:hypothetical protein
MTSEHSVRRASFWMLGAAAIVALARAAFAAQSAEQQAPSEIRTSPIYATTGQGTPVTALRADDLEVKLGGQRVAAFTLIKGGSPNKLVFIIFDTASLGSNALYVSKKIAQSTVARAGQGVRFVVMSVDPGAGLNLICGPTTERETAAAGIAGSIVSKIRSPALDVSVVDGVAAPAPRQVGKEDREQIGTIIIDSLKTLSSVLARFPESNKVVHFYSGGIPQGPMMDRSPKRYTYVGDSPVPTYSPDLDNFTSPSTEAYENIRSTGWAIKKSGAVLFAIDASGVLKRGADESMGEPSLRLLVNESGGRFFKGTAEELINSLAAAEQGYYELVIGVPGSKRGEGVPLEVRAKDRALRLSSAGFLPPTRPPVEGR